MFYVICFIESDIFSEVTGMNAYPKYKLQSAFDVTDLVNVSYYKLLRGYRFPGESHPFWEFLYVDRGELVVTAGSASFLLKAGELVFHCPNEFHSFQASGQNPVNVIVMSFYCDSPYMAAFERKILFLHQTEKQCLSAIVKESEASYVHFDNVAPLVDMRKKETAPFGGDQLIKTSLEQFLIHVYRRNDNIHVAERTVSANQLHHHAQLALQAREYLGEHYGERITLALLAGKLGISVSQLKRIYREQTGVSVIASLTSIRISEAKRLIRESNLNFSQIAETVGYDSIYYFSTLFKKQTGMTLTEYSKSVRP